MDKDSFSGRLEKGRLQVPVGGQKVCAVASRTLEVLFSVSAGYSLQVLMSPGLRAAVPPVRS